MSLPNNYLEDHLKPYKNRIAELEAKLKGHHVGECHAEGCTNKKIGWVKYCPKHFSPGSQLTTEQAEIEIAEANVDIEMLAQRLEEQNDEVDRLMSVLRKISNVEGPYLESTAVLMQTWAKEAIEMQCNTTEPSEGGKE